MSSLPASNHADNLYQRKPLLIAIGLVSIITRCQVLAQSAPLPTFEVASLRPSTFSTAAGTINVLPGGTLRAVNYPLRFIIQYAFNVLDYSFVGPNWLSTTRFDITAKPATEVSTEQTRLMLRALLIGRLSMRFHSETKAIAGYSLAVAKDGSKVKPAGTPTAQQPSGGAYAGPNQLSALKASMDSVATALARRFNQPVVDRTGLKGVFTFMVRFAPPEASRNTGNLETGNLPLIGDSSSDPSIFTAMQDELGLRLDPEKLQVQILVIDSIERSPVDN